MGQSNHHLLIQLGFWRIYMTLLPHHCFQESDFLISLIVNKQNIPLPKNINESRDKKQLRILIHVEIKATTWEKAVSQNA